MSTEQCIELRGQNEPAAKTTEKLSSVTTTPFRLLTKREVAAILGCTERTIDRMISARSIPFIQIPTGIGRRTRRRIDLRDIEQWLDQYRHSISLRKEGRESVLQ
jgi:excisionase family DNA binding protein